MRRINISNKNKRGASTLFLAIILSAVILVECTFLAFVWNLDYALTVNTALKTQIDVILSDYNRQLFACYGVYAFLLEDVDDECFNKALEINGLSAGSTLYAAGYDDLKAEDLRKAIASYYWYRGAGISIKGLVDGYGHLLKELDEKGVIEKVGEFMESPASGYVSQMIKSSESAEDWIGKAEGFVDLEKVIDEAAGLNSIKSDFNDTIHEADIGIDVDIADWNEILDTLSFLESAVDTLSDESLATTTKFYTSHYCSYNFDCWIRPEDDASINGTSFSDIHEEHMADSEYIITGLDKDPAVFKIEVIMAHIFILGNILRDYADEKIRNTIYKIADVISMIIFALSEGSVDIDPRIIAAGLTVYVALVQGLEDMFNILRGQRAVFFEYEDIDVITLSYRDILFLISICTPEDELLERSLEVLSRDFGTLCKGIEIEADFRGETYSLGKSYQLYQ